MGLMKIMTNNSTTMITKAVDQVDKIKISANKIVLTEIPSVGETMTVRKIDNFGVNRETLTLGDPTTNPLEYSISEKTITLHTSQAGEARVYYKTDKEVENLKAKSGNAKAYRMTGLAICEDIKTGKLFKAYIEIPNGQIQPNTSYQFSNTADVPEATTLTIDILDDPANPGVPFEMSFVETNEE